MNGLAMQSFGYGERLIRAVDRDGVGWFVGNDVCGALEISNARHALSRLDEDERDCVAIDDAIGRERETTIISEAGVYSLVFTSRKEAAKQFKRWVTHEVLPAIRQTGRYEAPASREEPASADAIEVSVPDDMERLKARLNLVREARYAFGRGGARRAWLMCGLPDLSPPTPPPAGIGLPDTMATLHRSIVEWLDARCEAAPGHRVGSMVLYHDYLDWAKERELPAHEVLTVTAFGRQLTVCGLGSARSNRVYRVGVRLVNTGGAADNE